MDTVCLRSYPLSPLLDRCEHLRAQHELGVRFIVSPRFICRSVDACTHKHTQISPTPRTRDPRCAAESGPSGTRSGPPENTCGNDRGADQVRCHPTQENSFFSSADRADRKRIHYNLLVVDRRVGRTYKGSTPSFRYLLRRPSTLAPTPYPPLLPIDYTSEQAMSLGKKITLANGQQIPQIGLGTWLSAPGEVGKAVRRRLFGSSDPRAHVYSLCLG